MSETAPAVAQSLGPRAAILALLLAPDKKTPDGRWTWNAPVDGKTRLVKELFLFDRETEAGMNHTLAFEFTPGPYGPSSMEVTNALDDMIRRGDVAATAAPGSRSVILKLVGKAGAEATSVWTPLSATQRRDLYQTKARFRDTPYRELLARVYKDYPRVHDEFIDKRRSPVPRLVTVDWGYAPTWIGIYVAALFGLYFGARYEMSVIRQAGDRFHDAFASKVHDLQQVALREITNGFANEFPTLRKLIVTPPKAPSGDAEEDSLRADFDKASTEVESVGSRLEAVKHPDDLFTRGRASFEQKSNLLHKVVLATIALSLFIPLVLFISVLAPAEVSAAALLSFYLGVFGLIYIGARANNFWILSKKLDADKAELEAEVDKKVYRIRKVGSDDDVPPNDPPLS